MINDHQLSQKRGVGVQMDEFLESQYTLCQSFVKVRWKKLVDNLHHDWFKKETVIILDQVQLRIVRAVSLRKKVGVRRPLAGRKV